MVLTHHANTFELMAIRQRACRCGVCNGSGEYVDVLHECCPGVLDAAGICCESGVLDDCGVCDGDHATCAKAIEWSIMMTSMDDALGLSESAMNTAFR